MADSLSIKKLTVRSFRNLQEVEVEPDSKLTLILGGNGEGKSNLLEAIATTTLTRSPRASLLDLIETGREAAAVDLELDRSGRKVELNLRLFKESENLTKAERRISGKGVAASEVLGYAPTVLFWPDDLDIVKGSPEGRRRLLDGILQQLSPSLAATLVRHRLILEQRNALLKGIRQGRASKDQLEAFTLSFAEQAAPLQLARVALSKALAPFAKDSLLQLTSLKDTLSLEYLPSGPLADHPSLSVASLTAHLFDALMSVSVDEISKGQTTIGPHRDDLDLKISGAPARTHASQGQQRTLLLALKLAELSHLASSSQLTPILLLDDTLSELDDERRTAFLQLAGTLDVQTFLTSADHLELPGLPNALRLQVVQGKVSTSTKVLA